jgi:hypothetical protein
MNDGDGIFLGCAATTRALLNVMFWGGRKKIETVVWHSVFVINEGFTVLMCHVDWVVDDGGYGCLLKAKNSTDLFFIFYEFPPSLFFSFYLNLNHECMHISFTLLDFF